MYGGNLAQPYRWQRRDEDHALAMPTRKFAEKNPSIYLHQETHTRSDQLVELRLGF